MNSKKIRNIFFDYFKSKNHKIIQSAPITVNDDPTLMFTNAGMNQFKDIFLGNESPSTLRKANTQKCLRVSGKHNDLEEVGIDKYHHTMFEMLGNWSFGDYFKKDAIEWAWDLLVNHYKLDEKRLFVTVFGGDSKDNLDRDDEAAKLWNKIVDNSKIIDGSKSDNFWEMGEVGPCGPCSEIFYDHGDKLKGGIPGSPEGHINGVDLALKNQAQKLKYHSDINFMSFKFLSMFIDLKVSKYIS